MSLDERIVHQFEQAAHECIDTADRFVRSARLMKDLAIDDPRGFDDRVDKLLFPLNEAVKDYDQYNIQGIILDEIKMKAADKSIRVWGKSCSTGYKAAYVWATEIQKRIGVDLTHVELVECMLANVFPDASELKARIERESMQLLQWQSTALGEEPGIDATDRLILVAMANDKNRVWTNSDLEDSTHDTGGKVSRKTIGERMPHLLQCELVRTVAGRMGHQITDNGLKLLKVDKPSSRKKARPLQ